MEREKVMSVVEFEDKACFAVNFKNIRLEDFDNPGILLS